MHYKLIEGENQLTINPKEIKSNIDNVFINEYLAKPIKCDILKDELIPIKWRLNLNTNKFESYEYLIGNIKNSQKYKKIANEFEKNIKLQNEIKNAINKTGYNKYFGILLRYQSPKSESIELNWEKNRESKTTVFNGDNNKFKQNKLYQQLYKNELIETSWIFYKIDDKNKIKNSGNCTVCYCSSHCGSHCVRHKYNTK